MSDADFGKIPLTRPKKTAAMPQPSIKWRCGCGYREWTHLARCRMCGAVNPLRASER